jgi:hypothetical protein
MSNYKNQKSNSRKAPNTKIQDPGKLQKPKIKIQRSSSRPISAKAQLRRTNVAKRMSLPAPYTRLEWRQPAKKLR